MSAKWILFGLCICAGVSMVYSQNRPVGLSCDIGAFRQWIRSQSLDMWREIGINHDFTAICEQFNLLITTIGGCLDLYSDFLDVISDLNVGEKLAKVYNYLAIMQFYCDIARPNKICNEHALAGCAVSVVGTAQQRIEGTFSDVLESCDIFNQVLVGMKMCIQEVTSDCSDSKQEMLLNMYEPTARYFEFFGSLCRQECTAYISLLANQYPDCGYVLDYRDLDPPKYCTYMQKGLECIWSVHDLCPVVSQDSEDLAVDTILVYGKYFGCIFELDGRVAEDVDSISTLPNCIRASLDCTQSLLSFFGIQLTAGLYGGYDVKGVLANLRGYIDNLQTRNYGKICETLYDAVWTPIATCTEELVSGCPTDTPGYWANLILVEQADKYLGMACDQDCANLDDAYRNIDKCWNDASIGDIDWSSLVLDIIIGLGTNGASDSLDFCIVLRNYVKCTIGPLLDCSILYDNWITIISKVSDIQFCIQFCNIKVDLSDGSVSISTDKHSRLLEFCSGTPAAYRPLESLFAMSTMAVLAHLGSRYLS